MRDKFHKRQATFSEQSLQKEILTAIRFGLVGGIATLVHLVIVWILVDRNLGPVLIANCLAFIAAFGFSFTGNYYWTFKKPGQYIMAMRRFFLISVTAFAANTLLLALLLEANWVSPMTSVFFAAMFVPLVTFIASRFWGFSNNC